MWEDKAEVKVKLLMIDDCRDETHVKCRLDRIDRNYWMGLTSLATEVWDVLYLDHDLHSFNGAGKEFTGYDIMCFLEENPRFLPRKKIVCVSSNPPGRARIEQVILKLYGSVDTSCNPE